MSNVKNAFPLENLAGDIARNNFNYQSVLSGLIEWNTSKADTVTIRLSKDTNPYFEDYTIPTKKAMEISSKRNESSVSGMVYSGNFSMESIIEKSVYGGTFEYDTATFNPSTDIESNEILINATSSYWLGCAIKFVGDDLPQEISASSLYYVVAFQENSIQISSTPSGSPMTITPTTTSSTATIVKYSTNPVRNQSDRGDVIVVKPTISSNGTTKWRLHYAPVIYDWESGSDYRFGNIVRHEDVFYHVIFSVSNSTIEPASDSLNFRRMFHEWEEGASYMKDDIVTLDGSAYVVRKDVVAENTPANDPSAYRFYATEWTDDTDHNTYTKGQLVYLDGKSYLCKNGIVNDVVSPDTDAENWMPVLLFRVPKSTAISATTVVKQEMDRDAALFILANDGLDSNDTTKIHLSIETKEMEQNSIYDRSVGYFPTSNYACWPDTSTKIWRTNDTYETRDIDISKRQDYSAMMVFEHTDQEHAKTINFINYDGPDLDQGLCIYLPIVSEINGGYAYPEDGFTYDFFFRIWPVAAYTNAATRDHIINKAQIYVYSAPDTASIKNDQCGKPIAKFSMSRATNMFIHGENVSIPDKPVCYRATFVYSKARETWMLFDYYQLPDHIFLGPVGFIDPNNPANLDINADTIGDINPNAAFIGYETAGFPLFQDPFTTTRLTPYRVDLEGWEEFKNRIM